MCPVYPGHTHQHGYSLAHRAKIITGKAILVWLPRAASAAAAARNNFEQSHLGRSCNQECLITLPQLGGKLMHGI